MAKLVIYYDPMDWTTALPDGKCKEYANQLVSAASIAEEPIDVVISNHLVFNEIRIAVKKGLILPEDVEIRFNNELIRIYPSGGVSPWPDGFCDHIDKQLLELI